jgi:hypothetical protein
VQLKDLKPTSTTGMIKLSLFAACSILFGILAQNVVPEPKFVGCTAESHARLLMITKITYLISAHILSFVAAGAAVFFLLYQLTNLIHKTALKAKSTTKSAAAVEPTFQLTRRTPKYVLLVSALRRSAVNIVNMIDEMLVVVMAMSVASLFIWIVSCVLIQNALCVTGSGQQQLTLALFVVCTSACTLFCFIISRLPTRKFVRWFERNAISVNSPYLTLLDMTESSDVFDKFISDTVHNVIEINSYGFVNKRDLYNTGSTCQFVMSQTDLNENSQILRRELTINVVPQLIEIGVRFTLRPELKLIENAAGELVTPQFISDSSVKRVRRYEVKNTSVYVIKETIERDLPLILAEIWEVIK